MSVVTVDDRGRLTLPRKLGVRSTRAVVIPAGSFIVVIPLPSRPSEHAKSWLKTGKSRAMLKKQAEELARRGASKRARRRDQLAD